MSTKELDEEVVLWGCWNWMLPILENLSQEVHSHEILVDPPRQHDPCGGQNGCEPRWSPVSLAPSLAIFIQTGRLAESFPGEPVLAYFEFAPPAGNEVNRVIEDAVNLAKAGGRIDVEELGEKTGYKLAVQNENA